MKTPSQALICGKRKYYSRAAASLVEATRLHDPVRAIEALADELLREAEVSEIPVPLQMLASFRGVVEFKASAIKGAGRLTPKSDGGFIIEFRDSDPKGRQRFSAAHEIGHLLLPSYHDDPIPVSDNSVGDFCERNEEEFFCDMAAKSLLLPKSIFLRECADQSPSIVSMLKLAESFEASIEAMAIRLNELQPWDCIAVVWELSLKPTQKETLQYLALPGMEDLSEPVEEFRVKFPAGSESSIYFPIGKHIPQNNELVTACLSGGRFSGFCIVPGAKKDVECYVEAMLVPYLNDKGEKKQRIVSLVFSKRLKQRRQACGSI